MVGKVLCQIVNLSSVTICNNILSLRVALRDLCQLCRHGRQRRPSSFQLDGAAGCVYDSKLA